MWPFSSKEPVGLQPVCKHTWWPYRTCIETSYESRIHQVSSVCMNCGLTMLDGAWKHEEGAEEDLELRQKVLLKMRKKGDA